MDYKKSKAPVNTVTRNIMDLVTILAISTRVWPLSQSVATRYLLRSSKT